MRWRVGRGFCGGRRVRGGWLVGRCGAVEIVLEIDQGKCRDTSAALQGLPVACVVGAARCMHSCDGIRAATAGVELPPVWRGAFAEVLPVDTAVPIAALRNEHVCRAGF